MEWNILRCPITGENLRPETDPDCVAQALQGRWADFSEKQGLVNASQTWFYPVLDGICLLLPVYAMPTRAGAGEATAMSFDKERVFRYYNEIEYKPYEDHAIYEDSDKWVDYRPVAREYMERSFSRARNYLNGGGKFYLDVASGPIGLKEYLALSDGYEYRICVDISYRALQQAKRNYRGKGIFICGDITNLPLQDGVCDAVLSQHTLYHVPAGEQRRAVEELYRVTRSGGRIGIVYSWFYHSPLMNLTLLPVQLYRIARHIAGKVYVRLFPQKPRLYFFVHGRRFFKNLPFGDQVEFYAWRSLNKYFLNLYVHQALGGDKFLRWISELEEKYPRLMGRIGEYPIIVIDKK